MKYNFFRTALPVHPQGTIATCFHRTRMENIGRIFTEGFRHGDQQMYGPGLYTCFDLKSQLQERMEELYGDVIIEFKINLSNILNLENLNKESKASIISQLKNIFPNSKKFQKLMTQYKDLNLTDTFEYTSDIAKIFYPLIMDNYDGTIFNGRNDGLVCVMYNYSGNAIPFRIRDGKTGEVTKTGITQAQKIEIDKMSWVNRIVNDRSYLDACPYKDDPAIEEALAINFENEIKTRGYMIYEMVEDNYAELFKKYQPKFEEALVQYWESLAEQEPVGIYENLLHFSPDLFNKYKDRLTKKLIDGWESRVYSYPDQYLHLKYIEPEVYNLAKDTFDQSEDACVKNLNDKIKTYKNEYGTLESKYPEFFNKWKEQFDEAYSKFWIISIDRDPINYISLQKNAPHIFEKYKDMFVQFFLKTYPKEIRNQFNPEKYGLKSEGKSFNWHKLSSGKNIAPK